MASNGDDDCATESQELDHDLEAPDIGFTIGIYIGDDNVPEQFCIHTPLESVELQAFVEEPAQSKANDSTAIVGNNLRNKDDEFWGDRLREALCHFSSPRAHAEEF